MCGAHTARAEAKETRSSARPHSCASLRVLLVAASAVGLGRVQLPRQSSDEEEKKTSEREREREREGEGAWNPGYGLDCSSIRPALSRLPRLLLLVLISRSTDHDALLPFSAPPYSFPITVPPRAFLRSAPRFGEKHSLSRLLTSVNVTAGHVGVSWPRIRAPPG